MTWFAWALVFLLTARVAYLHRALNRYELLRLSRKGWFSLELRRFACLSRPAADTQMFPRPREHRVLVLRFAGIPLWREVRIVGLPLHVDARIGEVGAGEFDHLFQHGFQMNPSVQTPGGS